MYEVDTIRHFKQMLNAYHGLKSNAVAANLRVALVEF